MSTALLIPKLAKQNSDAFSPKVVMSSTHNQSVIIGKIIAQNESLAESQETSQSTSIQDYNCSKSQMNSFLP